VYYREGFHVVSRRFVKTDGSKYEYGAVNVVLPRELIGKRAKVIVIVEAEGLGSRGLVQQEQGVSAASLDE